MNVDLNDVFFGRKDRLDDTNNLDFTVGSLLRDFLEVNAAKLEL